MVHQIFGAIGAYAGALIFDVAKTYDAAFIFLAAASWPALAISLMMRHATEPAATNAKGVKS